MDIYFAAVAIMAILAVVAIMQSNPNTTINIKHRDIEIGINKELGKNTESPKRLRDESLPDPNDLPSEKSQE